MAKESVIWNKTLKALKAVTRGMGVVVGFTTGFVVALLIWVVIGLGIVVCVPSVRTAVLDKGVALANEYTDWDIELGRLYLSPFHHSPLAVIDRGCGSITIVFILTLFGWIPGVIGALIILNKNE